MSPNHKAYMAITVHFEDHGTPMVLLLDLVEAPKSHTEANLADAFAEVLETFGIKDMVSSVKVYLKCALTYFVIDSKYHN